MNLLYILQDFKASLEEWREALIFKQAYVLKMHKDAFTKSELVMIQYLPFVWVVDRLTSQGNAEIVDVLKLDYSA